MRVCGVIAEYDPFHKGHERHLRLAREKTQADFIVCVMSGFYTQRGMPALLPPSVRAEMVLRCGADVVLQMPAAFSVREGDVFARGGVEILQRLGCVDALSFGSEVADERLLRQAAAMLENGDEAFEELVRKGLSEGLSYAASRGRALEEKLGPDARALSRPNAALGLSYLRALMQLKSSMQVAAVAREADYHADEMEAYPSATAVRGAVLRGDWQAVQQAVPSQAWEPFSRALQEGALCHPRQMDGLVRHVLMQLGEEGIARLPGVDEGLESRIYQAAREHTGREAILQAVKTRRYTRGRIARALCWAVLGKEKNWLPAHPACVQVLGFREKARPLMRKMQEGDMPLVMRPAREKEMAWDLHAADLWYAMAGLEAGRQYRTGPVILPDKGEN